MASASAVALGLFIRRVGRAFTYSVPPGFTAPALPAAPSASRPTHSPVRIFIPPILLLQARDSIEGQGRGAGHVGARPEEQRATGAILRVLGDRTLQHAGRLLEARRAEQRERVRIA